MNLLTKSAILGINDLKHEDVPVPQWGGTVRVRAMTGQERDEIVSRTVNPQGAYTVLQFTPGFPITPGDGQVVIVAFDGLIDDGRLISFPAETITGLDQSTAYRLLWDLVAEEYLVIEGNATVEREDSRYVDVSGFFTSDGTTFPTPDTPPDGWFPPLDPNFNTP